MNINPNNRLNIRVGQQSMAFAVADPHAANQVVYEPFITKSGISIAANMREAFKQSELLNRGYDNALLIVDTPTLLIPLQEFDEEQLSLTGFNEKEAMRAARCSIRCCHISMPSCSTPSTAT